MSNLLQLPLLIKEVRIDNFAGPDGVGRRRQVDDGPVGEHGDLASVVEVRVVSEGEAAVEHDVAVQIQRVGMNQNRSVVLRVVGFFSDGDIVGRPLDRQLVGDLSPARCSTSDRPTARCWMTGSSHRSDPHR